MFSIEFNRRQIVLWGIAVICVAALLPSSAARAQFSMGVRSTGAPAADAGSDGPPQLSGDAASTPTAWGYHILPANTEAGKHAPLNGPFEQARSGAAIKVKAAAGLAKPGFFPADLSNFGGQTVPSKSSEDIYYNCPSNDESCWGDPQGFLSNLSASKFIHVTDQYTGLKSNNRYPLSSTFVFITNGPTFLSASDVQNEVHQAAQLPQVGPGHIFHLFLPQGVDTCMDQGNTSCYSPDQPSTFTFCAYHAAVTFGDTGTLLYTVEGFQDVGGCVLSPPPVGYPNGELADSTNSTLSHELFETITDPYGGLGQPAWIGNSSAREDGQEIGDECQGAFDNIGEVVPAYILVRGRTYQTQLEYSNSRHGCVVAP